VVNNHGLQVPLLRLFPFQMAMNMAYSHGG